MTFNTNNPMNINGPSAALDLSSYDNLFVSQVFELGEFLGFETRNKYQILNQAKQPVAYAAEQQKGLFGWIMRQFLGHWRSFDLLVYNSQRQPVIRAHHPFRIFFQRLEVFDLQMRPLGVIQQRWSFLSKRFDVFDVRGLPLMEVSSPIWKLWTFEFMRRGRVIAAIRKQWSGIFSEVFSDRDNFLVEFSDPSLTNDERKMILTAAIFVDLQYFEQKAK